MKTETVKKTELKITEKIKVKIIEAETAEILIRKVIKIY